MRRTGRRRGKIISRESSQKRYHTRSTEEARSSVSSPCLTSFEQFSTWCLLAIQLGLYHVLSSKTAAAEPLYLTDNEYSQSPISHAEYFVDLETAFYNSSIVVPLTANDAGTETNWINGTVGLNFILATPQLISIFQGAVDIYGYFLAVCS